MKKRRVERLLEMPDIIGALFPHKVYLNANKKEGEQQLLKLVAGFRDIKDAELFLKLKTEQTGHDYVLHSVSKYESEMKENEQ